MGKEITKNYIIHINFIDSARIMTSTLSNFVNNLGEGIHKTKCKNGHDNRNFETCRLKYKDSWTYKLSKII